MGEEFTEELFSEDSSLAFEEDLVRQASYLTREDSIIVGIVNYMGVVVLHLYRRETYHWEFRRKRILNSSTDTISPWRLGKLPHGKYLLTVTIHNGEEPVKYGREFTVHLIP